MKHGNRRFNDEQEATNKVNKNGASSKRFILNNLHNYKFYMQ